MAYQGKHVAKKAKKTKKKSWLILLAVLAVLAAAGLLLWSMGLLNQSEEGPAAEQAEAEGEAVVGETQTADLPIMLTDGLQLTALTEVSGNFPEDGSDEFVPSLMAATIENTGDKTLQYAQIILTINSTEYLFTISTIPAGRAVRAFEMNRQSPPETVETMQCVAQNVAWFGTEPSLHDEELEIAVLDGGISITNVSGSDLTADFSIYYKNVYGDVYSGGITYRLRITDDIKAGETITGYAAHAAPGYSEIMFVTYD